MHELQNYTNKIINTTSGYTVQAIIVKYSEYTKWKHVFYFYTILKNWIKTFGYL
jgi:hypothetical protein